MCSLLATCGFSLGVATSKSSENPRLKRGLARHGRIWAPYTQITSPIRCLFYSTSPLQSIFSSPFRKSASRPRRQAHFCKSSHCIWGPKMTISALKRGAKEPLQPPFSSPFAPWSRRVALSSLHGPFKDRIIARDLCIFIVHVCTWPRFGADQWSYGASMEPKTGIWS